MNCDITDYIVTRTFPGLGIFQVEVFTIQVAYIYKIFPMNLNNNIYN